MNANEQNVLAWLQQHPAFLHEHATALGLRPDEAKIRSFNQGTVAALKEKTERMANQLAQMLADTEQNQRTHGKLLAFNRALLSANTLAQLAQAASTSLRTDFALPHHVLKILQPAHNKAHLPVALNACDDAVLHTAWADLTAPRCSQRLPAVVAELLPADVSLNSFLQLPVCDQHGLLAVLVIGHEAGDYFHPGLATDLVADMAQSLSVAMSRIMGRLA